MRLKFSVNYKTQCGSALYVLGNCEQLGDNNVANACKLNLEGEDNWSAELEIKECKELIYKYCVKGADGIFYEAGAGRKITVNESAKVVSLNDQWQGNTNAAAFLTSPFTDVYYAYGSQEYLPVGYENNQIIIKVTLPNVPKGYSVCISGDSKELGEWNLKKCVALTRVSNVSWYATFSALRKGGNIWSFKFVLKDKVGNATWEEGENRVFVLPKVAKGCSYIKEYSSAAIKVDNPKYAGVSIPVFSLRSSQSCGIGDFADLKKMVDWAKKTGLSIIQLLPINDTSANLSWRDSYPYNCISTLALHPIYISLNAVGQLKDSDVAKQIMQQAQVLNKKESVDYEGVLATKLSFLNHWYNQEKNNILAKRGFKSFVKQNREWLEPYAAFCVLRDKFKSANFRGWGEWAEFSVEVLERVKAEFAHEFNFHLFVQWELDKQMQQAKAYAHKNGVALKGDIPIGICRDSVEAWQYPTLFNFNQQAGAPPDAFSKDGQNWGFPTYNWEEMEKDNYSWWRQRFTHFAKYFDAYRIDHILGFFRIWEIPIEYRSGLMGHFYPAMPMSKEEIESWGIKGVDYNGLFIEDPYQKGKFHPMIGGKDSQQYKWLPWGQDECYNKLSDYYFYHRHNEFWYKNAVKKLQQLIACTNMLPCGEDLGMLNESVSTCMQNLKILSLELMIMPKQYGVKYGDPAKYPYLSVCTTSTHDCETLRMWLSKDKEDGSKDVSAAECLDIVKRNISSGSMFVILPLQDWLSLDETIRVKDASSERINIPSDPFHYWKYRMHIGLEELCSADKFNFRIKELLMLSSRTGR
ncbi:MAG: 4-alpha-glucanotransferase [Bacteroidia bacterium]|nr:4-alpha-glucanotransferase [Bacteroidia bacterium]